MRISEEDRQNFDVSKYDVLTVAKLVEQRFPSIYSLFNTKTIESPNGYYSYKALANGLTGAIIEFREQAGRGKPIESNMSSIAGLMEKHNFPTYYVSGPLLQALKKTKPPTNVSWADVHLPFPAICFMVPRGSLVEPGPNGCEIILVGVASLDCNGSTYIPGIGNVRTWNDDVARTSIFWLLGPGGLEVNDSTFHSTELLEPSADWIDSVTPDARKYSGPPGKFASWVAGLVANMVLVMQARSDLVESGSIRTKTPKGKEVWSPTFIGKKYGARSKVEGEPSAHNTELGWRAGHMKPRLSEKVGRPVWVEPYIAHTRKLVPNE